MVFFLRKKMAKALIEGNIPRVEELLAHGADVNMDVRGGQRPLHIAAITGNRQMISFLIGRGANVDMCRSYQWAPIHDAAYRGRFEAVVELLKAGANPNLRTTEGKTAYGWAVARKHPEVAEILSPYMKKVVEVAVEHNLKIPAAEPLADGWTVLSPEEIARTQSHEKLGYRLTDIFNFRDRERIRIVNNLDTRADQVQMNSFDDFADRTPIENARLELQKRGGNAPESELGGRLAKLPRPQGG